MAAQLTRAGDVLVLAGVLDFDSVVTLEAQGDVLLRQLPSPVRLDLSGISYSSSAGLALLLAWQRSAQALDKRIVIAGMPADMRALARVGGVEPLLPLV